MTQKYTITKRAIAISTMAQIVSQLIVGVFGVLIIKIMTNALGVHSYGVYATILAFVSTFSLLTDLGLNAITGREIAKQPEKASEIIGHNVGLRLSLCLVMVPLISGLGFLFYPHATTDLRYGILLFSGYLFFDAIRAVMLAYFTARVLNGISAVINAAQQFILLLCAIALTTVGWGLFGYLSAYLFTGLIGALAAFLAVRRYLRFRVKMNIAEWRLIMRMSISLGLIQVVNMMYLKADSVMLSVWSGTNAVGLYGVAYALIVMTLTVPSYLMASLIPSMATADEGQLQKIVQKAFEIMMVLACLLVVGGYVVRRDAVLLVSGKAFVAAAAPFAVLALATAFSYLNNVFGFASVAVNKHHKMVYVSVMSLLLNIGLNVFLIPRYSIQGAAWATAASELLALLMVYSIFRKETGISVNWSVAVKPLIAAGTLFLLIKIADPFLRGDNPLYNVVVLGGIVTVGYFVALHLLHGLPEEIKIAIGGLRTRLSKLVAHRTT
ncbi:MAG TPA: flippase [Patescibacteria group bacterium]|nr:flippase [Patescibacteria group bacterium]